MGAPMCRHVLEKGYQVTVYNRTRAKAEALLDTGAQWAHSPMAVAEASDIVFTIVGCPADVREVYLGADGLLSGARAGAILVDMTTSEPKLAAEIAAYARDKGATAIDAPVSGGDVGAHNGTLSIMIGGEKDAVDAVMPLFEAMGQNIVHQGGPGSGQHTKMCNQIVIAGTMVGVCESLLYGARAGLDLERMLASITKGAAGCWTLDNLAPRVLKRNFEPGFFVEHFIKDMGIALDEAKRLGLALPGLALVHELYVAAKAQGHGRLGTHALMLALEQMAGISSV